MGGSVTEFPPPPKKNGGRNLPFSSWGGKFLKALELKQFYHSRFVNKDSNQMFKILALSSSEIQPKGADVMVTRYCESTLTTILGLP